MSAMDVLGWIGAAGVLVAYSLLTTGRWSSGSLSYQLSNVVFAGALVVWAVSARAWQPVVINGVWVLVGMVGIVDVARHRRVPPPHVGD
jgi:hypothetical protein